MVALVGRDWNQIIIELKEWQLFGEDIKKADSMALVSANRD